MHFKEYLKLYQDRVASALDRWLPDNKIQPAKLHEAMRYAVLGEGKRIRPVLVYASGHAFGVDYRELDGPAAAVEIIHAYSLIHDDLPAMDNDDLRRGRPTCHRAFDEATAILAGDALQALAFHVLAHDPDMCVEADKRIKMIDVLAVASGSRGMAGGQSIDLDSVGKQLTITELENMHIHKTGALIKACTELGALSFKNVHPEQLETISRYGKCIGLAFQIQDDILDVEGDTEIIGKPQGSDQERNKPTYPNLLGLKEAKEAARELHSEALSCLAGFDEKADVLRRLADFIIERNK
jgi:farnesyl diphosphate synthase